MKMSDCCCPASCCFVVLPVIVSWKWEGILSHRHVTLHCGVQLSAGWRSLVHIWNAHSSRLLGFVS